MLCCAMWRAAFGLARFFLIQVIVLGLAKIGANFTLKKPGTSGT